jgi:YesN/AraC family two-component response regulator
METVKKAADAGCRHYIIKPFKKEHLLAKVRETLDHEKPILRDKNEIKSQLGLDEETYQEIARTFVSMINDKIAVLEKWIKGETEEGKPLDLLSLLENAVYLGAERIKSVLEELTEKTGKSEEEMKDSEYRLLLKEFEILRDALPSSTPKQVPDVKKQNQKNNSERNVDADPSDTSQPKE